MSAVRVDLEARLGNGSGSGVVASGSIQLCHVCWERKAGEPVVVFVGLAAVEKVEGLKTSREPRESLGNGGMRAGAVVSENCSSSISCPQYMIELLVSFFTDWKLVGSS